MTSTTVHTRAMRARVFLLLAMAHSVTEVQPQPGVNSVKSARVNTEQMYLKM